MRISKKKAFELIDQKISQFSEIMKTATYENRYNEDYEVAYYGTETLLTELFSKEEALEFRNSVTSLVAFVGGQINYTQELNDYKDHLKSCISQLKVFRSRIQDFWPYEKMEESTVLNTVPFVSMSFDEEDIEINNYFVGILKSLQIDYETGERYSRQSIPEKVKSRIASSNPFIVIFVRRHKLEEGGYTTPSWLLKELGIASGLQKDIIAFVERDIKDIAGLNYEKEVIYFERNNLKELNKATHKYLEALREHKLI